MRVKEAHARFIVHFSFNLTWRVYILDNRKTRLQFSSLSRLILSAPHIGRVSCIKLMDYLWCIFTPFVLIYILISEFRDLHEKRLI